MAQFHQEAQLQGIYDTKSTIWGCTTACYDQKYIQTAGATANGTYMPLGFLPFDETASNKGLANYVKYTGKDKIAGLGVYAWAAGIELQQALQSVVKAKGNNGITRANLLGALKNMTSFDADGFIAKSNVGGKETSPCFVLEQVQNGKFVRVWPEEEGHVRLHPGEPRDGEGRPDQVGGRPGTCR